MLERFKYIYSKLNRWHTVLLLILIETKSVPIFQLGFHCNDPALSHTFTGDTIDWKWLIATVAFLPLIVMLLVEKMYYNEEKGQRPKDRALRWYKIYLFGFLLNIIVVEILKLFVGSPRPHFFDTCQPQEALTCKESEYVYSYTCSKAHWINQSDKSFPSGHTSLGVYAAVFIIYYLHKRTKSSRDNQRVILSLQVICLFAAVYCGLSRMIDHRHHWWDVLGGFALAIPILYYIISHQCNCFDCPSTVSNGISESSSKLIDNST